MRHLSYGLGFLALVVTLGACNTPAVLVMPDLGPPDLLDCKATPAACGICFADADCAGNTGKTRCEVRTHLCTECLPQNDNCPMGKVCTPYANGFACSVSCLVNADCAKLGGGVACCAGSCRDPKTDVMNCGGCNLACPTVPNSAPTCAAGKCVLSCTGSFKDCDLDYNTGCEVDTGADSKNCGACGNTCTNVTNGNALCAAGACSTACKAGFADCNKNLADGCEVDVTFDILNCGACGTKVPPAANATPYCDNGKPSFRCKGHFFDCDGNAGNGCELDASTDANNCGHCGNICPTYANASSSCAAAACTVACNANWGDCNKNVMDGCETPLQSDLKNCGACGKLCSSQGATPTCAAGVCTIVCLTGFADCNNDTTDGCEANLKYDSMNCNGCGMVCPMGTPFCVNGACAAINTKVAVVGAAQNAWVSEVAAKITATGAFQQVDTFFAAQTTPTLAQLTPYGAVLVFSDNGFADPNTLGNNLADYFDQGGQVVVATFANCSVPFSGRFGNVGNGYMLLTGGQQQPNDSLGTIAEPNSPLVAGLTTMNATSAYGGSGTLNNGAIVVASWKGGRPLVVRGVKGNRNLVSLNFYPPSVASRNDFWSGDGDKLLRNALLYR